VRLRLSVKDFWKLLPKEFYALSKEYERRVQEEADLIMAEQEWANWRNALVCCLIANAYRDPKKKSIPFKPSDFMPVKKIEKSKEMTETEMIEVLKNTTTLLGGEVKI
jgi:hypothetical protein